MRISDWSSDVCSSDLLWQAATGLDIYDGYGQTETVLLCANRPGMARRGSMGRPAPPFDLTVIDETGTRLPPGVEGNVALRTAGGRAPGLFLGDRGDPVQIGRRSGEERGGTYV